MPSDESLKREEKTKAFEALSKQVRRLFHRLKAAGDEIHQLGPLSTSHRAVLESLYQNGPQSVPAMARSRPVSRQHIQKLVNGLLSEKLVTHLPNPSHRSSPLIDLTAKGRKFFEKLVSTEKRILSNLSMPTSLTQLANATETLKSLGDYFESSDWAKFKK